MRKYEVLIFLTGAVTLSLELLASRVMTPYFGVSLYIWTGILSITLTFLAVGYSLGGRVSVRLTPDRLEAAYLGAPLLSAGSIVIATLVYPILFPPLSQTSLILGSFVGAVLLLALPLITLSAMNPLLIGLQRQGRDGGDAGAGRVFFISTLGSVAGVLITAFVFIPTTTNFHSLLILVLILCAGAAVYGQMSSLGAAAKRALTVGAVAIAAIGALLFVFKDSYLRVVAFRAIPGLTFEKEAEYGSVFGNIKVLIARPRDGRSPPQRWFLQDGLIQNRTTLDHQSVSQYTYALWTLARAYAPQAESGLVLGLGAGIVPTNLRDAGMDVATVDINDDVLTAATRHFGFDPTGIDVHIEDARTFVRGCRDSYDVIVIDLFLGDNVPDYLLTRDFFADARACGTHGASLVMNTFLDAEDPRPNRYLFATLKAEYPQVTTFTVPAGNTLIVATSADTAVAPPADPVVAAMPGQLEPFVRSLLDTAAPVTAEMTAGAEPVTDDRNVFSLLFAPANMLERQKMAGQLPPWLLVN